MSEHDPENNDPTIARLKKFIHALMDEVEGKQNAKKKRGRPSTSEADNGIERVEYTLKDKLEIFDRALKLEALVHKIKDDGEGSGFSD